MQGFIAAGGSAVGIIAATVPIIGAVVAIVAGLFSIFAGGPDLKPIIDAVNKLARDTATALDQLKRFAWSIGRLALEGLFFIARIVGDMLQPILNALKSIAAALKKIYDDVIKPALGALRNIRKILDDVYRRWLRPIINFIQRIRQLLAIFRLFGFKWAAALDARLARIEGKIIGPYLWVLRQMNGYGSWLNIILTATGVIQRGPFLNSAYRYQGQLAALWWNSQTAANTPGPPAPGSPAASAPSPGQVQSDFQTFATIGGGPYQAVADQARSVFNAQLAGV